MPSDTGSPWRAGTQGRAGRLYRAALATLLLSAPACLPAAVPAQAQDPVAEQQRLLDITMRQPDNYEAAFEYVRVSNSLGDYEASIGTLERLLHYNADMTRVKYELASLYYRLGSYENAIPYFKDVLESPDLDPAMKARIETYLPEAEKARKRSRLSGFLYTGLRYQSNASASPNAGFVFLGGQDYALGLDGRKRSDWNWFALVGLSHDYDFQNQRGDVFETRFVGYVAQQFRLGELSLGLGEISLGPRFALAPEAWPGATIKPYVVGGTSWLDGGSYLSTGGAGVVLGLPVGPDITVEPGFEWRRASVDQQGLDFFSSIAPGDWFTFGTSVTVKPSETITFDARGFYRRNNSNLSFQSYDQYVVEAALKFEFGPPLDTIPRNWSVSPFLRYIKTNYDAANPWIDERILRKDDEWRGGVMLDTPLTPYFGVTTTVSYTHTGSNIPNYRTNNWSVVFGPTARF